MKNKTEVYLPKKVRDLIVSYLQSDKITTDDLYTIVNILKFADTPEETEIFFAGLAEVYPMFKEYEHYQSALSHISFEQQVKTLIPKLIVQDPKLATEVMKATQEEGMNLTKLIDRFPQLKTIK